jgi:uncharacterized protein (DUF983 family)
VSYFPPQSPLRVGLAGKCPRCGQGALYKSYLALADGCASCGLDYAQADSGDGPAVFVIFIVGFASVALAFIARFAWGLSIGAAFAVSAGFAIASILALLQPLKATMIALQYRNKAEEGRISE